MSIRVRRVVSSWFVVMLTAVVVVGCDLSTRADDDDQAIEEGTAAFQFLQLQQDLDKSRNIAFVPDAFYDDQSVLADRPQIVGQERLPGAAAQWTVSAAVVDSLRHQRLFNTVRKKHLTATSSGRFQWRNERPGVGSMIFENCTRAGEDVYGSDRVAIRFGTQFLEYGGGQAGLRLQDERVCDFRIIPSQSGFVPAGSDHQTFAIYSITANRYLVYRAGFSPLRIGGGLVWTETANGRPPGGVVARADFVPDDLFFLSGDDYAVVYLTIRNIGNVTTSGSQQEMKVTVHGQEWNFLVTPPVAPGATVRDHFILRMHLRPCELVTVDLDTNDELKFQIGEGAFSNDSVFANDKRTFYARDLNASSDRINDPPVRSLDCEPIRAY